SQVISTDGARGLPGWLADARDGLAVAFADPAQRALAFVEGTLFVTFGMFMGCYTLFVTRELGLSTGPLGMVYGLGGLSSLVASLVAPRVGAKLGTRGALTLGLAVGAAGLGLAVLAPRDRHGAAL